jgi:hypothetical protein
MEEASGVGGERERMERKRRVWELIKRWSMTYGSHTLVVGMEYAI